MKVGDYVKTWFDSGGGRLRGWAYIYGVVVAAGPKTYTVRWESDRRNRVRQGDTQVEPVRREDVDAAALRRLSRGT